MSSSESKPHTFAIPIDYFEKLSRSNKSLRRLLLDEFILNRVRERVKTLTLNHPIYRAD